MRRSNIQSLGSAIKDYLKDRHLDGKMAEIEAVNAWETLLGVQIARATESINIKDGTLYVTLRSSIVRNELFMMRNDIINAMNQHVGRIVVKAIVLK